MVLKRDTGRAGYVGISGVTKIQGGKAGMVDNWPWEHITYTMLWYNRIINHGKIVRVNVISIGLSLGLGLYWWV